jgi:hypothetical protein
MKKIQGWFRNREKKVVVCAVVVICMMVAAMLSGCTAFNNLVKNDALITQLAVEAATARTLHEHPQWRAATIRISNDVISVIDGEVVSDLASIEGYVIDQIEWSKMVPEEQALVSVLIGQVRKNLEDSFRANGVKLPEEQLVSVRQLFEWIRAAARRA